MSQLYKIVNGFDAMSGAAFGGGSKSSSRSKSKSSSSVKKWKNPIRSHPSAMSSTQYNNAYNQPGEGASGCLNAAVIGGGVKAYTGAKSTLAGGGIPTPASAGKDFVTGAVVTGATCVVATYF